MKKQQKRGAGSWRTCTYLIWHLLRASCSEISEVPLRLPLDLPRVMGASVLHHAGYGSARFDELALPLGCAWADEGPGISGLLTEAPLLLPVLEPLGKDELALPA